MIKFSILLIHWQMTDFKLYEQLIKERKKITNFEPFYIIADYFFPPIQPHIAILNNNLKQSINQYQEQSTIVNLTIFVQKSVDNYKIYLNSLVSLQNYLSNNNYDLSLLSIMEENLQNKINIVEIVQLYEQYLTDIPPKPDKNSKEINFWFKNNKEQANDEQRQYWNEQRQLFKNYKLYQDKVANLKQQLNNFQITLEEQQDLLTEYNCHQFVKREQEQREREISELTGQIKKLERYIHSLEQFNIKLVDNSLF